MTHEERKSRLIALIHQTEDEETLFHLEAILTPEKGLLNRLHGPEKIALEKSIRQADAGMNLSNEEVMARLKKWL